MNENFEALKLSTSMAEEFITKVTELETNLTKTEGVLGNVWKGSSFDNLSSAIKSEQEKLVELKSYLNRVVKLIGLVNEHNEKRRRRSVLKKEIAELYPRLKYKVYSKSKHKEVTRERPEIRAKIDRRVAEVEAIYRRLDQLVNEIDSTTSI